MSGSASYELNDDGASYAVSEIEVSPVSFDPVSLASESDIVLTFDPAAEGAIASGFFEIGETLGGEEVGAAYFSNFSIESLRTNPTTGLETSSGTGLVITSGEFDAIPCFADGSLIDTVDGPVAVERLRINDRVVLASGGSVPVVWTGSRRQRDGLVVRIRAGALGRRIPTRDLIVSSDHGLYLDKVLVQAGLLVNGETIVAEHRHEVTFWHVELEQHGILLAEGLPAESYLDTGNRRQFSNCALGYDPAALGKEPFAEMVFAGKRLDIITARLKAPVPR